ncbi:tautomerase family protein [Clostridium sp. BL-8]|uniref:tautomerase family protein n=1 Tax=Clostridium sp. BL-8 TaxID=349938 RepID=UPI00098C693A|nr:tautomerase family protein [Clostridium sp. BL-8]OOM71650.1 putative tautomerase [Clostridium sp. BL-8]
MPFVNLKIVKNQVTLEKRKELIKGLTDLIVNIMGRERELTVITVDELEASQWAIGGVTLDDNDSENNIVTFVNIKVSKGTTNPDEIDRMMKATKELIIKVLGSSAVTNYFIIDELNPDGWGFDGVSMTEQNKMEQ